MNATDARTYARWYRQIAESAMLLLRSISMDDSPARVLDEAKAIANAAEWMAARLDGYATQLDLHGKADL